MRITISLYRICGAREYHSIGNKWTINVTQEHSGLAELTNTHVAT